AAGLQETGEFPGSAGVEAAMWGLGATTAIPKVLRPPLARESVRPPSPVAEGVRNAIAGTVAAEPPAVPELPILEAAFAGPRIRVQPSPGRGIPSERVAPEVAPAPTPEAPRAEPDLFDRVLRGEEPEPLQPRPTEPPPEPPRAR